MKRKSQHHHFCTCLDIKTTKLPTYILYAPKWKKGTIKRHKLLKLFGDLKKSISSPLSLSVNRSMKMIIMRHGGHILKCPTIKTDDVGNIYFSKRLNCFSPKIK